MDSVEEYLTSEQWAKAKNWIERFYETCFEVELLKAQRLDYSYKKFQRILKTLKVQFHYLQQERPESCKDLEPRTMPDYW
jgi:hypothetical protein